MVDEESGLPYYYHTKTGETVWERPTHAFVIPLRVLQVRVDYMLRGLNILTLFQNTALSRRLSLTNRNSKIDPDSPSKSSPNDKPAYRRSRSYAEGDSPQAQADSRARRRSHSTARLNSAPSPNASPTPAPKKQTLRRSVSSDRFAANQASPLSYERGHPLAPIPGSPYATDASPPPSPSTKRRPSQASSVSRPLDADKGKAVARFDSPKRKSTTIQDDNLARSRSSKSTKSAHMVSYHSPQPQSLNAALEKIALQTSQSSSNSAQSTALDSKQRLTAPEDRVPRQSVSLGRASGQSLARPRVSIDPVVHKHPSGSATTPNSPTKNKENAETPPPSATFIGREISAPVFNVEATLNMMPVKMRNAGKPILVERASQEPGRTSSVNGNRHDMGGVESGPLDELGMYFSSKRRTSLHTGCVAYPCISPTSAYRHSEPILLCRMTSHQISCSSPRPSSQDSTSRRIAPASFSGGKYP